MKRLLLVFILILTPFAIFAGITISDDSTIYIKGFYEGPSGYIFKIWESDKGGNSYTALKNAIISGTAYDLTNYQEIPSSSLLSIDGIKEDTKTGIFVWYLENKNGYLNGNKAVTTRPMKISFTISPLQAHVGYKYYVPAYEIEMYRFKTPNNESSANKIYDTLTPYASTQVEDTFITPTAWQNISYHPDYKGTCGICYITINDYVKDVPGTFQYTSYVTVELWIQ